MIRGQLLILVALARIARADPPDPVALYQQGQEAFDAARYDAAIDAWQQSLELSHAPDLLFNLGQAYRLRAKLGDCGLARDAYKKFIELAPESPQRPLAEGFAFEMNRCDAREHAVPPTTDRPIPRGRGWTTKQKIGVATAGAGGVLVGVGVFFSVRTRSLADDLTKACQSGCTWQANAGTAADGARAHWEQFVFYGVGAAAIVGGGVLYWLGRRERAAPALGVTARGDGGVLTWSRTW